MIELKPYTIDETVLRELPPYYHFMTYNELLRKDFEERYGSWSKKCNGNFIIRPAEKPISQIINFMPFNLNVSDALFK
jgi:hypothetical protein